MDKITELETKLCDLYDKISDNQKWQEAQHKIAKIKNELAKLQNYKYYKVTFNTFATYTRMGDIWHSPEKKYTEHTIYIAAPENEAQYYIETTIQQKNGYIAKQINEKDIPANIYINYYNYNY